MKAARLVVLTVALAAGGIAAMLAGRSDPPPATQAPEEKAKLDTIDVLVAKADIGLGQTVSPQDMQWQTWPAGAAAGNFIKKSDRPDAMESLSGSIARAPFVSGEPIREQKLVNAKGSGFMAAILPSGMRAVSTEISPETGAAGFILPNDRVDVILTRKDRDAEKAGASETQTSETILSNIRVLAIDQTVEDKNGQKVVVGKTATLEVSPPQAETLTMARQMGVIYLALRSITDSSKTDETPATEGAGGRKGNAVNVIRFGVGTMTTPR